MAKILILDCHFLCHRAKYSYCDITDISDKSGVIFGFLKQVMDLAKIFNTNQFVFCWDSAVSLRKKEFPEYKEKRNNYKEELSQHEIDFNTRCYAQFDVIRNEVLKQIGFKNSFIQPWYETDDLVARIVMDRRQYQHVVVTRDQDFYQLLLYCDMYDPINRILTTSDDFVEEWGISPSKWAEVKAIAGCKSDSVPGVKGVAEKTAIKYITHKLKPTTKKYKDIINSADIIERNRRLVTLPFPGTKLYKVQPDVFNFDAFYDLCNRYAMDYFLERRHLNWWRGFFEGFHNDNKSGNSKPRAFA